MSKKRRLCLFLPCLFFFSLPWKCQGQTVTTAIQPQNKFHPFLPQKPQVTHLSELECPSYRNFGALKWIPSALDAAVSSIERCEVKTLMVQVSKTRHLQLLEYEYCFRQGTMFGDKETYQYIVDKPSNILLWGPQGTDGCNGYLSGWKLHKRSDRAILELKFFTGGTGGFWEDYYALGEDRLVPIKESFGEQANALIPKGYQIHRTAVNMEDLTCVILLSTDKDPNCCPSGRLDLRLNLVGNNLEFSSGVFSRN